MKKVLVKIKGTVYQSCLRSVMLYGSKTWCYRENEMTIFRRTERVICVVRLIEKRRSQEFMGLKDTLDGLARASGVRWYGEVLRRDSDQVLRRALDFEVVGKKGCE